MGGNAGVKSEFSIAIKQLAAEKNLPSGARLRLPVGLGLLAIASAIIVANV